MICREREWLADAEAVQFTRNPLGIEGALKKIGGTETLGPLTHASEKDGSPRVKYAARESLRKLGFAGSPK